MDQAEDNTCKPELEGPPGHLLCSFRSERDELDAVDL